MSRKALVSIGMLVGSVVGGYLPIFFGVGMFSYTSILTSGLGAIIGIWIGYKLGEV